jgi:hypothetical protein
MKSHDLVVILRMAFSYARRLPIAAGGVAAFGFVSASTSQTSFSAPLPPGATVTELKYWNGRGLMDTPRMMMVIAGKKFQDVRIGDGPGLTPYGRLSGGYSLDSQSLLHIF